MFKNPAEYVSQVMEANGGNIKDAFQALASGPALYQQVPIKFWLDCMAELRCVHVWGTELSK